MHCFPSRLTSWLTRTLSIGGVVVRLGIGASVIGPSRPGRPTQHQRCTQETIAIPRSQPIPRDRHREIKGKFCTIVGGVASPLLANIYMNRFLKHWRLTGRGEAFQAHVVSYADDFVILSRGRAAEALTWTRAVMTRLGLSINEAKTSLKDARQERFDFLGYSFGPHYYKANGRRYLGASPSKKSVQRLKAKVANLLTPGHTEPWEEVRDTLNRSLRGWSNYFAYGTCRPAFRGMDQYVTERVRAFLARRHKVQGRGNRRFTYDVIHGERGVLALERLPRPASPWAWQ